MVINTSRPAMVFCSGLSELGRPSGIGTALSEWNSTSSNSRTSARLVSSSFSVNNPDSCSRPYSTPPALIAKKYWSGPCSSDSFLVGTV